jgi:DNA-directed RNA polymerase specialized sigma24 family protein
MNLFREQRRHPAGPLEDVIDTTHEPSFLREGSLTELTEGDLRDRVWEAVAELPQDSLNVRVLLLRYREGRTTAEIAAATDLTPKQVWDRLRRTVARLGKKLDMDISSC